MARLLQTSLPTKPFGVCPAVRGAGRAAVWAARPRQRQLGRTIRVSVIARPTMHLNRSWHTASVRKNVKFLYQMCRVPENYAGFSDRLLGIMAFWTDRWHGNLTCSPREVARVEHPAARIVTRVPSAGSVPDPREAAPNSSPCHARAAAGGLGSRGRLSGFRRWGNQWIDWSSGVLIANAGHGRQEIADAIARAGASHLLTNYCFPSEIRARLVERLASISARAAEESLPADHRLGDRRMRHQAVPQPTA